MMQSASSGWTLDKLLNGLADGLHSSSVVLSGLSMDSRLVERGDLFLACQGASGHGLDYVEQVVSAGAAAIVYEPAVEAPAKLDIPLIPVSGLRNKAGRIADRFFQKPSAELSVIAITGTNGKTSVSHYVAQALNKLYGKCGLLGTLGYGLYGQLETASHTTPDVVRVHQLMSRFVDMECDYAVMEVSSHALDQGRVDAMRFAVAVFTNLSRDHLDYHGDMKSYAATKRRLFDWDGLKSAVINADDPVGMEILQTLPATVTPLAYSMSGPLADIPTVSANKVRYSLSGMQMDVVTPAGNTILKTGLIGRFNGENILAALAILLQLGISLDEAVCLLESVEPVAGRMQSMNAANNPLVVVDYAHTADALEQALKAIREHVNGDVICVFGCGGDRDPGKRPEMGSIAERAADIVIITDDNPRSEDPDAITQQIIAGISNPEPVRVIHDRKLAIQAALQQATAEDAVLIAGKGHESVQLIGDKTIPFDDSQVVADWLEAQQ